MPSCLCLSNHVLLEIRQVNVDALHAFWYCVVIIRLRLAAAVQELDDFELAVRCLFYFIRDQGLK